MPEMPAKTRRQAVKDLVASLPPHHCDQLTGRRIAKRRKQLGLRQEDLSRSSGPYIPISAIETGRQRPSLINLLRLSLLLDINPDYLAWGRGDPKLGRRTEEYIFRFLGVKQTELYRAYEKSRAAKTAHGK
jgi:transcriptional regulator with XRE-family HTH domain